MRRSGQLVGRDPKADIAGGRFLHCKMIQGNLGDCACKMALVDERLITPFYKDNTGEWDAHGLRSFCISEANGV